eukprot:m.1061052 g.1061052  ORF g.1061052 m.1061052 type:complete len:151 (+) comp24209_c0_seq122:1379-1831(+)
MGENSVGGALRQSERGPMNCTDSIYRCNSGKDCGRHRRQVVCCCAMCARWQDGNPIGKRVLIVDDLIKSGGTIAEAAKAITSAGATAVAAFCTHAAGRPKDLLRFLPGGDHHGVFSCFYLTNSVPDTIAQLPDNDLFQIIDIMPQVIKCL